MAEPPTGEPQVPRFWPEAMLQTPVQQSVPAWHTSPVCWQNDDGWHVPFVQSPEQQGVLPHGLP